MAAEKGKQQRERDAKRRNRTTALGDLIGGALDPAFRKRGFASHSLVAHWQAIAPAPYDRIAMPDRLAWPRPEAGAEGAVLYLRCLAGHGLALTHEGDRIAQAVNRYFGYYLVSTVKLSVTPFESAPTAAEDTQAEPAPGITRAVAGAVADVEDDGLKSALTRLGTGILGRKR